MITHEIEFHKVSSLPLNKENYRGHVFFNDATNEPTEIDEEGNESLLHERGIYLCAYDKKGNLDYISYTLAGASGDNTGIDVDTLNDRITLWASKFQNDIQKLAKLTVDPDQIMAQVKTFYNELNGEVADLRIKSNQITEEVAEYVKGVKEQYTLIEKTTSDITTRVDSLAEGYTTIKQTANNITSQVETLETGLSQVKQTATDLQSTVRSDINNLESRISQTAERISSVVEGLNGVQSQIDLLPNQIKSEVSNGLKSASILAAINNDESEVKIKADKIQLGGIIINDNDISSNNGNFKVTSKGELTTKSGSIGGIKINENSIASSNGNFSVTDQGKLTATDAELTGSLTVTRNINGTNKSYDIGDYVIGKINNDGKFDMSETVSGAIAALNEEIYGPTPEKDEKVQAYNERVMKSNTLLGRVLRAEGKILALQNDIKALQNVIELLKTNTNTSTEDTKINLGDNNLVSIDNVVTFSCTVCGEKFLYGRDVTIPNTDNTYGEVDSIVCPTCGAIAYKGLTVAPEDKGSSDSGSTGGSSGSGSGSGSGGGGTIGDYSGSILDKGNTRPTLPTFDLSQNTDITIQ